MFNCCSNLSRAMSLIPPLRLLCSLLLLPFTVFASNERELHALLANGNYEPEVVQIVADIKLGKLDAALEKAQDHLQRFPKSRIGHLLKADILAASAGGLAALGQTSQLPEEEVDGLSKQLKNRWHHFKKAHHTHGLLPSSLIDIGNHPYVLVGDMKNGRLYVYQNVEGQPDLIRDYYMSVGSAGYGKQVEGDNKTPIGVYHVNRYIEGKKLPDLYGKGAFPVNYPNLYDRFLKRTGYGIWLHGTPSTTYARAPWTSEGCFVLSNDDLLDVAQFIDPKLSTPVILSDEVEWISRKELNTRRSDLLSVLNRWKSDWESIDTDAYVSHYKSDRFNFGRQSFSSWAKRKEQVNLSKTFIQIDLQVEDLFTYPGEKDMFVVNYTQRYLSNNYEGIARKRQFWKRSESGRWQILYEG